MKIKPNEKGYISCLLYTSNGALLAVAATNQPAYLYGVEIQEAACKLAEHNLKDCGVPFTILAGDAGNMTLPKVDVVICNPPYFKAVSYTHLCHLCGFNKA